MIRVLVIVAVVGFLVASVSLGAAAALGGREIMTHGWNGKWAKHWGWVNEDHDPDFGRDDYAGPTATREIAWDGSEELDLDVPAEVRFTQAEGPGKLVITGPQGLVNGLRLVSGRLYDGRVHNEHRVTIVMTAPKVIRFDLSGADKLTIENFDQDSLDIDASGFARIIAAGQARAVRLDLSGAGEADLGGMKVESADIELSGAGKATIAPSQRAKVDISGIGQVTLLTDPPQLETDISGAGRIIHAAPKAAATPAAEPATKEAT